MKIALISCGRSDYSIYLPLIKKLDADSEIDLEIIAFGTHVSNFYGHTVDLFRNDGFEVSEQIESLVLGDSPDSIATSMGLTMIKFSNLWQSKNYDCIIVLGDRFEMFSAIAASVPFNIPVAHLHGGETTLGAIDDKFRHCITTMSTLHFVTTEDHADRVVQLINSDSNIFNVGAPALDNLKDLDLMSIEEFNSVFGIDLNNPTILITFHPETVNLEKNIEYTDELIKTMESISGYQLLITMPNADTMGTIIREKLNAFIDKTEYAFGVEILGARGYYSCMEFCSMLIGNTSSGIIEAASFAKYVINVGDRQKGRSHGPNVIHSGISQEEILGNISKIESLPKLDRNNIYGDGNATQKIVQLLKEKL